MGKKSKGTYRIRNWSHYNASLVQRGSLTLWIDEEAVMQWQEQSRTGERGRPRVYTEMAITCMAMVEAVYHLPLRATEGLLRSVVRLAGMGLPVPHYTTLCRRRKNLEIVLPRKERTGPFHLVIDSTGIKVYGEGEWKVRQHGYCKRRTWRKLHIGVDEATQEIVAAVVTTNDVTDSEMLPELLSQVEEAVGQVSADGAYDKRSCYDEIRRREAQATIPPRKDAKIWKHGLSTGEKLMRDENLRTIRQVGRSRWKQGSGYHRRSLAETAMFRFKTIFGDRERASSFEGQATQILIKCAALNRMTHLGMPDSYLA